MFKLFTRLWLFRFS